MSILLLIGSSKMIEIMERDKMKIKYQITLPTAILVFPKRTPLPI
jgi:hypothetical protein